MSNSLKKKKLKDYCYFILLVVILDYLLISNLFNMISYANINKEDIKLDLVGDTNQVLTINEEYIDEGVKVTLNDEELTKDDIDYTVENNVNTNAIGEYTVTYHIMYNNKTYDITRNVSVVDNEKPSIIVLTSKVSQNKCGNNLLYYAFDNYDGVLTDKVKVSDLNNSYELRVSDSANNETVVTVDKASITNNYVLTLNGTLFNYVEKDSEYVEKGVTVTDICGKEVNVSYSTEGSVDTSKTGTYTIRYYIDGVDSFQERKVIVYDKYASPVIGNSDEKVIYLTFDDGPGAYTEELLDILNKYNVKATFFVTAQFNKYIPLIEREAKEGHAVGLHTKTHEWNIYRSFENYYKDFSDMNAIIKKYTGSETNIFRFPGGGSNTISKSRSLGIMKYNVSKMSEAGYVYYDWNIDSGDAAGANSKKIYNNVITGISDRNYSIILMHDIKRPTIDTIEKIIVYALDNGYTFKTLSSDSPTVHHHVNN
ncbi:MAG: polysaccharide deacetylase [Erysipelotrichales bacterium]|nr:polysaccharide deacetylase [Erysipelotrichales bacterium]